MSILSDKSILERLRLKKDLIIKPLEYNDIQPCSVDLHLGSELKTIQGESYCLKENSIMILEPGDFILGSTKEYVEIPDDLAANVDGKSSLGRLGITAHITAGYIDAGFKGNITLEIANLSDMSFILKKDMAIAQIVFTTLTTPTNRPYGSDGLNSHYQDSNGTILSAIKK